MIQQPAGILVQFAEMFSIRFLTKTHQQVNHENHGDIIFNGLVYKRWYSKLYRRLLLWAKMPVSDY